MNQLAFRNLTKRPLFALTAITILGIGIGATTAVFSLVHGLLLEPLPYPDGDRLVRVWKDDVARGYRHFPLSYLEFREWAERSKTLESAAAMWTSGPWSVTLTTDESPRRVQVLPVTSNFFDVLGVSALHGRTFEPSDDRGGETPAVVLSHRLWTRALGSDPGIVGQPIRLLFASRELFRVAGVLPPGMDYPAEVDAYVVGVAAVPSWAHSRSFECDLVARLREGASTGTARAELAAVYQRLVRDEPQHYPPMEIVVQPLLETIVGDVGRSLWILLGAVGLVSIVGTANVAGLLLARGYEREREMAVRLALGAGRLRLAGHVLAEAALLVVAGGAVGLLLAFTAISFVESLSLPRARGIGLEPLVLGFGFAVTLLTAASVSLLPALRASRRDLGRTRNNASPRAMRALVAIEVALAFVLAVGAGLLVRSLAAELRIDRGFVSEGLVLADFEVPGARYGGRDLVRFTDRSVAAVTALPGVSSATPVHIEPGTAAAGTGAPFIIEGQTLEDASSNPMMSFEVAHENYFRTLGVPIIQGRAFETTDRSNHQKVAIVSETFARRYWADTDPIGKRFRIAPETPWLTVVGVAGDVRYRQLRKLWLNVYFPPEQNSFRDGAEPGWFSPNYLVVRSSLSPDQLASSLRSTLRRLDADIPVDRVVALEAVLSRELARPRVRASLLSLFAGVALVLAAVGLYGVMATTAHQSRSEVGVRLALGSTPGQAVRLLLWRGASAVAIGVVLGSVLALAGTRFLQSVLHGVGTLDPASFFGAAAVLGTFAFAAAYPPARRAACLDPGSTLRRER